MKKYSIIYADPPWHYKTYSPKGNGRSAEKHYPTMSIAEIKALPVEKLAADDCAMFMWITFPCMKEAFEVLEAWGFQYKTVAFVWVKQNRVSDGLFWGHGLLDSLQCGNMHLGNERTPQAGVLRCAPGHYEPCAAP